MDPIELSFVSAELHLFISKSQWARAHSIATELANTKCYAKKHPEIHDTLVELEHRTSGAPWRTIVEFDKHGHPVRPKTNSRTLPVTTPSPKR